MKKKLVLVTVVLMLIVYVLNAIRKMGVFRKIENNFEGEILKQLNTPGDEDITIAYADSFAIISSTKRLVFPPQINEKGTMYYMDLKSGEFNLKELTTSIIGPFAPHGISIVKVNDYYRILVVNGKIDGHSIESFRFYNDSLIYDKTFTDALMVSPNDVLALDDSRFYFTNDHHFTTGLMRKLEEYLDLKISGVVFFNGEKYQKSAYGMAFANGINIDRKRNLIYVAASRDFLVKVYSLKGNGELEFIENINVGTGVDNVEVDPSGMVWIAGHPNLLKLASYEKGTNPKAISPSEVVTLRYKGKGDYTIKKLFLNDGHKISASTVAAPFGDYILLGDLMDTKFLVLKQKHYN
ncbi:MAG: SMP-30/gluconolactonase/LRE family protein [Saprospiraceae bacterium]